MSRSRLVFVSVVAAIALAVTLSPAQSGASNDDVMKKLDSIEQRIASLERTLGARLTQLEQTVAKGGGAAGAAPAAQLETEAQAAYAQINQLMTDGKFEDAKKSMGEFMAKYGSTKTAQQAQRVNQELQVIGKPVPPDWGIEKWYQGEDQIDLASKKTTLLVFWEVWCPHCKREVPKLQEIYNDLKGEGLQVVGLTKLTRSSTEESAMAFIKEQSVGYPIAKENGSASTYFGVSGIPAAAVVRDGKVIWRGHPARLSEDLLKSWL